jgi:DNA-binding NarL/FixJ family response regulator
MVSGSRPSVRWPFRGLSGRTIAKTIGVSEATIRAHPAVESRKLGADVRRCCLRVRSLNRRNQQVYGC